MNAGRAPERIRFRHLADEFFHLGADLRTARSMVSRLPYPEQLEAFPVPSHHGFGSDDDQRPAPVAPEPRKKNPEKPVPVSEPGALPCPFHDGELLPEREIFDSERGDRVRRGDETRKKNPKQYYHKRILSFPR